MPGRQASQVDQAWLDLRHLGAARPATPNYPGPILTLTAVLSLCIVVALSVSALASKYSASNRVRPAGQTAWEQPSLQPSFAMMSTSDSRRHASTLYRHSNNGLVLVEM